MGSGHILVYAFDVLMDIYRSVGYTDRDAVQSIVQNNLYGLDIDDRAAQLAYFAVMMKACEYDRRFLRRGVQPHVCAIAESVPLAELSPFGAEKALAQTLLDTFRDGQGIRQPPARAAFPGRYPAPGRPHRHPAIRPARYPAFHGG